MENELLTIKEIAEFLRVKPRSIYNYCNLRKDPLPFIKIGGSIRFRLETVEEWLRGREQ